MISSDSTEAHCRIQIDIQYYFTDIIKVNKTATYEDAIFNYLHTFLAHFTTVSTSYFKKVKVTTFLWASEKLFEIAQ